MERSQPPARLNFLREQNTEQDIFKYKLWHKLNDLVHDQIKQDC